MPMASCRVTIPRSPDPVEMIAIGAQELPMELAPPRMFGCTRCQTQVFICSDCDRGQIVPWNRVFTYRPGPAPSGG